MKRASIVMMIGSIMLLGALAFPLWNIQLGAPQYPDPLGMNIFMSGIEGESEFDIQNIDGLNHYIGMKTLPKPGDMWEFEYFPLINIAMVIIGLIIGLSAYFGKLGKMWFLYWFVLMTVLSVLGIYDFNLWMIDYGTNLDPHAILKLQNPDGTPMTYKPPLIGHKRLLNFDAYSYPRLGAFLMFGGTLMALLAFYLSSKKSGLKNGSLATVFLFLSMGLISCSVEPQPIEYGERDCHFCKMTIVDKLHGAEIVTQKGKVYFFDAAECMVNYINEHEELDISIYLTNHYLNPEELIDAKNAFFLISPDIPSPMGANLTAFPTEDSVNEMLENLNGEVYSFDEILNKFKVNSFDGSKG